MFTIQPSKAQTQKGSALSSATNAYPSLPFNKGLNIQSRSNGIRMSDSGAPAPKTFLESPDQKSILVFRNGDMQKYELQESTNQYAQLAMKDIKVSSLSQTPSYHGPVSGLNGYLEAIRANHSAEKGVVIKDFGG